MIQVKDNASQKNRFLDRDRSEKADEPEREPEIELAPGPEAVPPRLSVPLAPGWRQLEDEPAAAYECFLEFLDQPAAHRTIREAARRARTSSATAYKYAGDWRWRARAEAYDRWDLEQRLADRDTRVGRARQALGDAAEALATSLLDLALGRQYDRDLGRYVPRYVPPNVQLSALRTALDRAGVSAARRVEISGPDGSPIPVEAKAAVAELPIERLREIQAMLRKPEAEAIDVDPDD